MGAPCAQNYMNHSRPSSADNARIGGAQVFAASRADEAAFPVEARSTTDEMRRVVSRHPAPPPGKPRAVPRLSLAGGGAEKEPGLASATWVALPQPLQTGGELLPPSSARARPEIASSARDRPEIAISLPTSPVTVSSSLSPPRLPSQVVSPQRPSPPEGSPVSGLSVSPRRRGSHGLSDWRAGWRKIEKLAEVAPLAEDRERHDMLGGWRGTDGYGGEEGKDLVGALDGLKVGFSNDWKA